MFGEAELLNFSFHISLFTFVNTQKNRLPNKSEAVIFICRELS